MFDMQTTDVLVIGSGLAGLSAAIRLAGKYRVTVVTRGARFSGNTELAQGGIAAAMKEEDSAFFHFQDTMNAGDSLCREAALTRLVEQGPLCVQELIDWGTRFDRDGGGLAFGREAAHRFNRILHARGDATGYASAFRSCIWGFPSVGVRVCSFPSVVSVCAVTPFSHLVRWPGPMPPPGRERWCPHRWQ